MENRKIVGMIKNVGHGVSYAPYFIVAYQRKGVGTMIVNHWVDYAKANSITGKFTTIGGVSAKGKEPFYEIMGFKVISNGIHRYPPKDSRGY